VDDIGAVHPGPRAQFRRHVLAGVVDAELGAERGRQLGLLAADPVLSTTPDPSMPRTTGSDPPIVPLERSL
jgi:hypothetical protein